MVCGLACLLNGMIKSVIIFIRSVAVLIKLHVIGIETNILSIVEACRSFFNDTLWGKGKRFLLKETIHARAGKFGRLP